MQHLDSIYGNHAAIEYLKHMLKTDRVHHTLLFHGPDGVGKATSALALAKDLGIKPSDIREFFPEGKACIHTVDSMSEVKKVALEHPYESKRKLLLIRDAEKMLPSSANALLKVLEEPLETTLIILTTTYPEAILETILSRSCLVAFRLLTPRDIKTILKTKGVEGEQAEKAAYIAQGNIARALMFEQEQKIEDAVFTALEKVMQGDIIGSVDTFSEIEDAEPERVFTLILQWFRDIHLLKIGGSPALLYAKDASHRLKQYIHLQIPELDYVYEVIKNGHISMKHNMKLRSILEGMMSSFIYADIQQPPHNMRSSDLLR